MLTVASHTVEGHVSRGFEAVREAFAENFARRGGAGRRLLRLLPRREGRRPLGRYPEQADGRAVGAGHDGARLLGHQGPGRDDPGDRPLARLARLRRAGRQHTGPSSRSRAKRRSPFANCSPTRRGCSRLMSPSIAASSPIWIAWRSCSPVRSPRGSPGRVRPITPSRSGFTKASCCAGSIRGIAASDSSFRTRSRHRSERTSTSACPRRSRTSRLATLAPPGPIDMLRGLPAAADAGRA